MSRAAHSLSGPCHTTRGHTSAHVHAHEPMPLVLLYCPISLVRERGVVQREQRPCGPWPPGRLWRPRLCPPVLVACRRAFCSRGRLRMEYACMQGSGVCAG